MDRVNCLKCTILPQRVVMGIMGFLAIAVTFTMRACLSVAITEMVVPFNNSDSNNGSFICQVDTLPDESGHQKRIDGPRFNWTQEKQGWILSAFFVGYMITHIPGGMIAEKYGGKWTLSLGVLVVAVCTAITPLAVGYGGHIAMIILRIVMGLSSGASFPALTVLSAAWVPQRERGKLGTLVFGGGQIGSLLSFYLSGLILSHWPWPVVYYFWSSIAVIWFILFTIMCSNDPASHPFITMEELSYLEKEMGQLKRHDDLPATPWKDIFTSVPVIALIVAQMGHDWVFYIMASDLPKYMKEVLGFSVHDVGLYSSLPYLLMFSISVSSGFLSDFLINHNFITITQARKTFTASAGIFPAIFIVAASYGGCDRVFVVISFTLAMGFMGNFYPGLKVNSLDLSPNYAGTLMAITNGAGALSGIAAPSFVGFMAPNSTLDEWRLIFWITFGIAAVRTIVFSVWASAQVQPWNNKKPLVLPECVKLTDNSEEMITENNLK